jgi:hypothetical protein
MGRPLINRATYGNVVVSRFTDLGIAKELKTDFAAFKAQHTVFLKFTAAVEKAERSYDSVATKVATLDAGRDKTILALADKLPGAGLGSRTSPFARFSKYAPTKLVSLPYMAETAEIRTLLAGVQGEAPPKDIAALCAEGHKQNEAVNMALAGLTVPLATLNEARTKRDAAIPDWEKHFRRLKDAAKVAYRDEAGRFDALFAEPDAVLTHTKPKTRKVKGNGAAAPEAGQAAPAAKKRAKPKARRGR